MRELRTTTSALSREAQLASAARAGSRSVASCAQAARTEAVALVPLHRQHHVLERGEFRQHRRDLERAREAEPRAPVAGARDVLGRRNGCCRRPERNCPESWLISVVLPAPFGPITACNSPAATSSDSRRSRRGRRTA